MACFKVVYLEIVAKGIIQQYVSSKYFQSGGAFIVNYGYIPRLFRSVKKAREDTDTIC
jgi:hypothetical protein